MKKIILLSEKSSSSFLINRMKLLTLVFFSCFVSQVVNAQEYKTELRGVDDRSGSVNARMSITQIQKNQFDELILKMKDLGLYTIVSEFAEQKNSASLSLKSKGPASVEDFQSFLKQVEIYSLVYDGKNISTQQIRANYNPPKKDEVGKVQR